MRGIREVEVDQHVGARLRSLRLMLGVTREKLAEIAGVTFQQIQKYETGATRLSPSKLAAIGEGLGVKPEYFFDGLPSEDSAESMPSDVRDFMASREGVAIMKVFQLLPASKRSAIIRLVQAIAERETLP
jgi:transcriptional regulator with XRE-family HTH domain